MSIPGLDSWLNTAQGRYVLDWERAHIDDAVSDVFGYNALQLGLPQFDLLAANRIAMRRKAGDRGNGGDVDVVCDPRQLPFATASVDLVLLPHVLEFSDDPHQVLREVERVLIPEGRVVIVGFNPLSLWGLRRRLRRSPGEFPWNGDYLSVARLKDWFKLLGLELDLAACGCYAPPCTDEVWLQRCLILDRAGGRWWKPAGGVYLLRAVKRVHGMRVIMPAWERRRVARKALAPVVRKEIGSSES